MRKLQTSDLFSFARVVKKSGVREDLVKYLQRISRDDDKENVGLNTILMVIEALGDAEDCIYDALSPVFEIEAKEIKTMPPAEFFSLIRQLSEENDLPNFFNTVFAGLGKS